MIKAEWLETNAGAMSSVAKHKGNGSSKAVPSTQRQRKIGVPALLLQALTISEAEGKEWDQARIPRLLHWDFLSYLVSNLARRQQMKCSKTAGGGQWR